MPNFREGPWAIEETTLGICRLIVTVEDVKALAIHPEDDTSYVIAYIPTDYNKVQQKANAHLIAAAPEMYEALKEAIELIRIYHGDAAWEPYERRSPEMQRIKAALAKAEGRS